MAPKEGGVASRQILFEDYQRPDRLLARWGLEDQALRLELPGRAKMIVNGGGPFDFLVKECECEKRQIMGARRTLWPVFGKIGLRESENQLLIWR